MSTYRDHLRQLFHNRTSTTQRLPSAPGTVSRIRPIGVSVVVVTCVVAYLVYASQGVIGFDFGRRGRGSGPRMAAMISLTMRCKKTSANAKRTDFALAA